MARQPQCCNAGSHKIEWRERDVSYGPDATGWSMIDGSADYGAAHTYCNVRFCPFCGKKIEEELPGRDMKEILAGNAFRNSLVDKVDGEDGNGPYWYGWAIMDAFRAGVRWAREQKGRVR